jgi:ubiquinone/menaquinone biosynthesis C-methylase UbiE
MGFIHSWGKQLRKPEGILGKVVVPFFMNVANRQLNNWTVDLLDIQPTDRVLELGFGPGIGICKVAAIATEGLVAGVDFSELMVRKAQKHNAAAISAGRVDLKHGDVSSLPYDDQTFDKVIAIQLIYFCQPPHIFLKESRRVLKPGGKIAVSFIAKEDMAKYKFTKTGVFDLYTDQDALKLLTEAGFTQAHFETKPVRPGMGICAIAER